MLALVGYSVVKQKIANTRYWSRDVYVYKPTPSLSAEGLDKAGHETAKTRKTSVLRVFLLPPNWTNQAKSGHQPYTKVTPKAIFGILGVT